MTTHPATPAVDWSPRYGALGGTASAASAAAAAGAVGDLLDWSAWWPVAAGVAGVLLVALTYRVRRDRLDQVARRLLVFYAAAWVAAAGWVGYVYHWSSVLHRQPWPPYLLGIAVAAVAALILTPRRLPDQPDPTGSAVPVPPARPYADWEARIARICRIAPPEVSTVEPWTSGNGSTVAGVLPDDGTVWQQLRKFESALASHLRLPHGCGVEFGPGADRGGFTLRVNTRDAMADDRDYPLDLPVRSILDPVVIGWHRDDDPTVLDTLREDLVLAAGATGSGKTNLLHDLEAGYQQCDDVVNMGIDLNGGALVLPWLSPWLEGEVDRPAFDWVATTVAEATRMVEWVIDVAVARRRLYRQLMRDRNTDLVPVSPQLPMIRIMLDEGAEAGSIEANPRLRAAIVRLIELGRAGAGRIDVAVLRATADVLPVRAKKQIGVRVGLKVSDEEEANHLYGWRFTPDPADTPYKGSGLIRLELGAPIRPFRTFRTALPGTIWRIATACAARRPRIDDASIDAAGRAVYEGRWDRTLPYLRDDDVAAATRDDVPDVAPRDTGGDAQGVADDATMLAPRDGTPAIATAGGFDFSQLQQRIRDARVAHATGENDDPAWAQAVAAFYGPDANRPMPTEDPPATDRPWLPAAVQLLERAGRDGMSAEQILVALTSQGLTVSRATLYRPSGLAGHPEVVKLPRGFAHRRHRTT